MLIFRGLSYIELTLIIISERGIQDAYKELIGFMGEGRLVKDLNENRNYIEEIKTLLSV